MARRASLTVSDGERRFLCAKRVTACGGGGALANAIYNATGVRVRDYPITLDKLIERLPQVA